MSLGCANDRNDVVPLAKFSFMWFVSCDMVRVWVAKGFSLYGVKCLISCVDVCVPLLSPGITLGGCLSPDCLSMTLKEMICLHSEHTKPGIKVLRAFDLATQGGCKTHTQHVPSLRRWDHAIIPETSRGIDRL